MSPSWLTLILNNTKLIFGLLGLFWYLGQFIGAVATINLYSDIERLKPCALTGDLADPYKAAEVFDLPFLLLAIYHIIEWLRATLLLTVIMIGVNWTIVWYITSINSLFGMIVYAFVHMAYFDESGELCGEAQPDRRMWLMAEIIAFWCTYFFFAFPFVVLFCRGKAKADATLAFAYEKKTDEED